MTSPPDVQNVPDVWPLLKRMRDYMENNSGPGSWANEVIREADAALAQRDRFVLVPREPTQAMVDATYEARNKGVDIGESIYYHMVKAMIAATPCPRHDPCERDASGYCARCHSEAYP